jgi:hypothetical protein
VGVGLAVKALSELEVAAALVRHSRATKGSLTMSITSALMEELKLEASLSRFLSRPTETMGDERAMSVGDVDS